MSSLRIAAAIRVGQMTYALPPPARHHTILWWLGGYGPDAKPHGGPVLYEHMHFEAQGFITSEGMFVDRAVGLEIAIAANQLIGPPRFQLYSEELW